MATIELACTLFKELMKPPLLLLNISEMLEVFGFFLMVLIGLELFETIRSYPREKRIHAEVVILVAIVAVSRKVIIIEYKETTPGMLYGISAIIIALGIAYFLIRKALDFKVADATGPSSRPEGKKQEGGRENNK